MGIGRQIAEALIREHSFKPLCGDVLLMGRQTIYYSPAQILAAFEEHGIKPAINPATIELDTNTIDRLAAYKDANLITDKSLMMLFGVAKVMALDHSSYENAEIVHDLRYPLPEDLCGAADLLIDGSTHPTRLSLRRGMGNLSTQPCSYAPVAASALGAVV